MTIRSMTGYASHKGNTETLAWRWEVKTVNNKGLDIRCRLPSGYEALEIQARQIINKAVKRGSVQASLQFDQNAQAGAFQFNQNFIDEFFTKLEGLKGRVDSHPPRLAEILAIKGMVVEQNAGTAEVENTKLPALLLESLEAALSALNISRSQEGKHLAVMMENYLVQIEVQVAAARQRLIIQGKDLQQRLSAQVEVLLADRQSLDEARLHQEVALLITRHDVQEELDRLTAHIAAARELLKSKEAIGRPGEFLLQEFNREANTLCSKSADIELTKIGLELKNTIDQWREQVQNVE
ncbi:MAG: YicC/YloC family endoribonuclease [Dongiaceae bacterium]